MYPKQIGWYTHSRCVFTATEPAHMWFSSFFHAVVFLNMMAKIGCSCIVHYLNNYYLRATAQIDIFNARDRTIFSPYFLPYFLWCKLFYNFIINCDHKSDEFKMEYYYHARNHSQYDTRIHTQIEEERKLF